MTTAAAAASNRDFAAEIEALKANKTRAAMAVVTLADKLECPAQAIMLKEQLPEKVLLIVFEAVAAMAAEHDCLQDELQKEKKKARMYKSRAKSRGACAATVTAADRRRLLTATNRRPPPAEPLCAKNFVVPCS